MAEILQFALLGLGPGALIAGLALSVVLTYRGSGVINMATGAIATISAFVAFTLRTEGRLWLPPIPFAPHYVNFGAPWAVVPSLVAAIAVGAFCGLLLELLVLRPLRDTSPLAKLLGTLGILLTVQAILLLRFGSTGQTAPSILPDGPTDTVVLFGKTIPSTDLILAAIVLAVTLVLALLYRFTRFGLATRAAAESEANAVLVGLQPGRLSLINTVLAATLAGAVGVLVAPLTSLNPTTIPLTIVPALGAALIARFTSFWTAALAGLGMGVIQSLIVYLQTKSWFPTAGGETLPGVADVVYFLIICGAMIWRGASLPTRGSLREKSLPAAPEARAIGRSASIALVIGVVAFLVLPFDFRQAATNSLIGIVMCLSLVIIVGFSGQMSLIQVALAGISGFAVSKLGAHAGIGFPFDLIAGVLVAVLFGTVVALSSMRVRGVNLAIVTLAGAVATESFVFENSTWGGGTNGSPVHSPHLFGINLGPSAHFPINGGSPSPVFGFVCVVAVVLVGVAVARLRISDFGKRMLAVRSNEAAAAGVGINVRATKVAAFVAASAVAGLAGVLYSYNFGSVSTTTFDSTAALTFVAFAYVGGITTVSGAVLGGLAVTSGLISHALNKWLGIPIEYQLLVGGLLLVVTIVLKPEGLAGVADDEGGFPPAKALQRLWRERRGSPAVVSPAGPAEGSGK